MTSETSETVVSRPARRVVLRGKPRDIRHQYLTDQRGPGECWEWLGNRDAQGYGKLHLRRDGVQTIWLAHRIALELKLDRALAADECALHSCDNPPCQNPAHLRVGTRAENNREAHSKRRHAHGEGAGNPKLTESQAFDAVCRIRAGEVAERVAADYGVSGRLLRYINKGRKWPHLQARLAEVTP